MELLTPLLYIEKSVESKLKGFNRKPTTVVAWARHDLLSRTQRIELLTKQKYIIYEKKFKYKSK